MDRFSVFFTTYGIQPNSSQRFYYHSNKNDSLNLITYIKDPHSYDDLGNKKFNFFNFHNQDVYDVKKGYVNNDKLEPVSKDSMVYRSLISFDENISKSTAFSIYWEDIINIVFDTMVKNQDWDRNNWEMQALAHLNTNNVHFHMRMYQNDKTPDKDIFKRFVIKESTIRNIKKNVWNFIKSKEDTPTLMFPHVLKRNALYDYNKSIKSYKNLIDNFVSLINLKELNEQNKQQIDPIIEKYYQQSWLKDWVEITLEPLNLTNEENQTLKNIIKNNISEELFNFVKSSKHLKAYDFVAKKDPNEKSSQKQKFKNFDKINQNTDFTKLATYNLKTIKNVYKEPFGRFIDLTFSRQQFNLQELEQSINNYIVSIRPNVEIKPKLTTKEIDSIIQTKNNQNQENLRAEEIYELFIDCLTEPSKNNKNFETLARKYFDNIPAKTDINTFAISNDFSSKQIDDFNLIAIKNISETIRLNLIDSIKLKIRPYLPRGIVLNPETTFEKIRKFPKFQLKNYKPVIMNFIKDFMKKDHLFINDLYDETDKYLQQNGYDSLVGKLMISEPKKIEKK